MGKPITNMRNVKTKDFQEAPGDEAAVEVAEDEAADPGVDEAVGDEPAEEKFSAQILRRIHEHHSLLMQEYDELAQMNEHEEIGEFVTKLLGGFEETLTAVEELFEKHHGDLPPLEGAMDEKDMGGEDEATEADSEEEELPTPDEVVEGMETKSMRDREDYGNYTIMSSSMGFTVYNRNRTAGGPTTDFDPHFRTIEEAKAAIDSQGRKSLKNGKQTKVIAVAKRKDMTKDEADKIADSEEEELPTPDEVVEGMETKHLDSEEKCKQTGKPGPCKGSAKLRRAAASSFARDDAARGYMTMPKKKDMTKDEADKIADDIKKEAADTEEKHLCSACKAAEGELTDDTLPGTPGDEAAAPPVGEDETTNAPGTDLGEESQVKSWLDEHRPVVGDSAVYLKGVSETQDFNDDSRHEAYFHGKMLDKMCKAFPQMEKIDQMSEVQAGKSFSEAERRKHKPGCSCGAPDCIQWQADQAGQTWEQMAKGLRKDFPAMDEQAGACQIQHPHYKACSGAGAFLKELSNCHDFGMPHQEKALAWHKELDAMSRQDEVAEVSQGDNPLPLGEMQEKNGIGNAEAFEEMDKQDDEVEVTEKSLGQKSFYVVDDNGYAAEVYMNGPDKGKPSGHGDRASAEKAADRLSRQRGWDTEVVDREPPVNERDKSLNGHAKSLAEAFIRAKEEQDEELKQMKELSRKLAAVAGKL